MPSPSPSSTSSPTADPAAAPTTPSSAAPTIPKASSGPIPGTARLATARPAVAPPAAPIAPPTAAPMALPIPGSSVSVTGTPASRRSGRVPGLTSPILFSGIPRLLNCLTAFSALSADLNTPVTAFIVHSSVFLCPTTLFMLVTFHKGQSKSPTQIVEELRKAMLESNPVQRRKREAQIADVRHRRQTLAYVGGRRKGDSQKAPAHTCDYYGLLHRLLGFTGMYRVLPDRGMHVLGARRRPSTVWPNRS